MTSSLVSCWIFWHREVFSDFDPIAVAKMNEKKILAPGSLGYSLLSELKLRAIIDNARQVSKVDSQEFILSTLKDG